MAQRPAATGTTTAARDARRSARQTARRRRNGHVTDDPRDLMYDGPGRADPAQVTLDPGHDDYFQTGRMLVCYDVASHPAWTT